MSIDNHPLYIQAQLTDRLWRFEDVSGTLQYLLVGSERAALIDTGYGVGSMEPMIRAITDKPIIVILTHSHRDHAMGAGVFEQVYMSHLDKENYLLDCSIEIRKAGIANVPNRPNNGLYKYIDESDWLVAKPVDELIDMKPGDVFDLGDRSIEVFEGAGHSPGSVMLLLPEERMFLTGDACNPDTRVWSSITEYRNMLQRVKAGTDGRYDRILLSHAGGECATGLIDDAIDLSTQIVEGSDDKLPFPLKNHVFQGVDLLVARVSPNWPGYSSILCSGLNIWSAPSR